MNKQSNPTSPLRIVIVDDHPIVTLGMAETLRELGHEIVGSAVSGEEALRVAAEQRPDLLLMDVDLKGDIDGITAAINVRNTLGIRSIFYTGYSDPKIRHRAASADPIAFLDKTSRKSTLAQILKTITTRP